VGLKTGFSLIETLVAIAVFLIGFLGLIVFMRQEFLMRSDFEVRTKVSIEYLDDYCSCLMSDEENPEECCKIFLGGNFSDGVCTVSVRFSGLELEICFSKINDRQVLMNYELFGENRSVKVRCRGGV